MLPARPKVRLLAPERIVTGTQAELVVELTGKRPTHIDWVDLSVVGKRFFQGGARETLRLGARLCGARELAAGKTELRCRVPIPADAPPSYTGRWSRQFYEADVHVSIPYWPDAHGSFLLAVRSPARVTRDDQALLFATRAGGPPTSGPYAEVSLATRGVAVGDVLAGAVALSNVASSGYAHVTVALVETEIVGGVTYPSREWTIDLRRARFVEGERLDFALRVPEIGPSLETPGLIVQHRLDVRIASTFRVLSTVPIPIEILPVSTGDAPRRAIHALGEERALEVWRQVARERGVPLVDGALEVGGEPVTARVYRALTDGAQRLHVQLAHAPLDLGLTSERRRGLSRYLGGLRSGGWAPIDDALSIAARDGAQGEAWLRMLARALAASVGGKVRAEALDDRGVTVSFTEAGMEAASIRETLDRASSATRSLAGILASIPLPPPLAAVEAQWVALSQRLSAELSRGSGAIRLASEGHELEVRPLHPERGLRLTIGHDMLSVPAFSTHVPTALAPHGVEAVRAATTLLDGWPAPVELHGSDREVWLVVEGDVDEALVQRVERATAELRRLEGALRGQAGAFR